DGHGEFTLSQSAVGHTTSTNDDTAVLEWPGGNGRSSFLIASTSYEDAQATNSHVLAGDVFSGKLAELVVSLGDSIGPIVAGALDGDCNMALFVSGSVRPARYP